MGAISRFSQNTPAATAMCPESRAHAVLAAHDLTKYYGSDRGVEGLSFDVRAGEIFGLLGPNGSGKTTTLRLILNFLHPTRGEVKVFGRNPARTHSVASRAHIGYLPGDLSFPEHETGEYLLDFYARLSRSLPTRRAEVCELLDLRRSELRRPVGKYSRGMRQKLGIVQALQHDPRLVLLDEPSTALDPIVQEAFYRLLLALKERGRTIILSSHVLPEVLRLCDRVGVLKDGRLVDIFDVRALLAQAPRLVYVQLRDRASREVMARSGFCDFLREEPPWFVFRVKSDDLSALLELLAHLRVEDVRIESAAQQMLLALYRERTERPHR